MEPQSSLQRRRTAAQEAWSDFVQLRFESGALNSDELDIEMEAMDISRSLVRQQRNARTITYRLPSELLCAIFFFTREGWNPRRVPVQAPPEFGLTEMYTSGWTVITRVCHRWREVALQTPALWCDVDVLDLSSDLARAFIQRGSTLPLTMTVRPPTRSQPYIDGTSRQVLDLWRTPVTIERLQSWSLLGIHQNVFPQSLSLLGPLPSGLHKLCLHVDDWHGYSDRTVLLPNDVICTPNKLQRLSLRGCFARPDNPVFSSSITHIDIHLGGYTPGPPISSAPEFLRLLSTMPRLEELAMYNFPSPSEDNTVVRCTLPASFKLLRWDTDGDGDGLDQAMATLVNGLRTPPTASMVLNLESCHTPGVAEELSRLILWDLKTYPSPLEIVLGQGFAVAPWRRDGWAAPAPPDSDLWLDELSLPPGFRCILRHDTHPLHNTPGAADLSSERLLNSVHAFTITDRDASQAGYTHIVYWLSTCALIPQTLCITVPLFHCYWLITALEAESETGEGVRILPNLEILAFEVLVDEEHSLEDHRSSTALDVSAHTIAHLAVSRRDMGSPLKEVRIRRDMASDAWRRVRDVVDVTIWP
ncbi:unnamed protein product [Peniophora sp. CBMAI 1063]|nr:unnamed protein product [Peniophora sp. CBMAI 1063]